MERLAIRMVIPTSAQATFSIDTKTKAPRLRNAIWALGVYIQKVWRFLVCRLVLGLGLEEFGA